MEAPIGFACFALGFALGLLIGICNASASTEQLARLDELETWITNRPKKK